MKPEGGFLNLLAEQLLMQRIAHGDRRATERLIDAFYEQVFRFHFSFCKNKETAEDLTQDTFVKAWKALPGFHGGSRVSTWLYRIAYNTFVDWLRRQQLVQSIEGVEQSFSPAVFDDVSEKILIDVRSLPAKQREVILMHYQHDLSLREIAKILAISTGTVKSRLSAALQNLRQSEIIKELR